MRCSRLRRIGNGWNFPGFNNAAIEYERTAPTSITVRVYSRVSHDEPAFTLVFRKRSC